MPTTGDEAIDAAFGSAGDQSSAGASTGDEAIDAAFAPSSSGYRPISGSVPVLNPKGKQPELLPMLWEGGKEAVQGGIHGIGTLADVATGTAPGKGSHAERWASVIDTGPTLGGQISGQPQISPQQIGTQYDKTFGTGPAAQTFKERIPQALEAISTAVPIIRTAGSIGSRAFGSAGVPRETPGPFDNSPQSMGAAKAVDPRLASAPPELQQAVRQAAQDTGGAGKPTG